MLMASIPGINISLNNFVELEIKSKRNPDQNRKFQCRVHENIIDFVSNAYKVDRKLAKITHISDKTATLISGKEQYTLEFV